MKWFQHQCDADENKKVRKIEKWGLNKSGEDGAMAATGRYWRLLEKIGKAEERNGNFAFEPGYDLDLVADDLRCSPEYLVEFCDLLAQINAIDSRLWQENKEIACPKLAERADEYYQRRASGNPTLYYGANWPRIQEKIRERDRNCRICGKTPEENRRALEVHHIEPLKNCDGDLDRANHEDNLIAVCLSCRNRIRGISPQMLMELIRGHMAHMENAHGIHMAHTEAIGKDHENRTTLTLTRTHTKKPDSTSVLSSATADPPTARPKVTPAKVFHLWNDLGCKPALAELTAERNKRLNIRIRNRGDPAWWERLFLKAKAANKPWLTFDFLIANDTNAIKLLEGNYDHDFGSRNNGARKQAGPGAHQKPNPANPGKFAARARILTTDPGGGGSGLETDSPGQGGVPGAPECPAG